jgi:hypothetical protein
LPSDSRRSRLVQPPGRRTSREASSRRRITTERSISRSSARHRSISALT